MKLAMHSGPDYPRCAGIMRRPFVVFQEMEMEMDIDQAKPLYRSCHTGSTGCASCEALFLSLLGLFSVEEEEEEDPKIKVSNCSD